MNRLSNAWRPMLLGAVLTLLLVGVAGAVPTHQPSALSSPRQLVISAADFYPASDDTDYVNQSGYLYSGPSATYQAFLAPVDFPAPNWVTIDTFELFGYDNNTAGHIEAYLLLTKPSSGTVQTMATINTGYTEAYTTQPRTWQTTSISPNVKNPANDVHVSLHINDDTFLLAYGVRIWYRVGK